MPAELGGYRLVELLGRGGMGEVWRAEREGPGGIRRRAAVKRILPRLRNDPVLRERFLAEARTNARLEHPNIVQVLDFGDRPEPYLILEYVEGVAVADLLSELAVTRTYLPAVAAAFIVAEAAAGLDYAHRRKDEQGKPLGIIHRDVSPQNILVSVDGAVKVTDFGIVRAADNRHRTQDGMSVGKLGYMSPEQVAGEKFDARADVFALGVLLWELLTLQPLLPRQDANAALQILLKGEFRRPSQINTALPPSIDQLVMPAMTRQPDQRVPSAGAFAQNLRAFIHSVSPGFDSGELMRILGRLLPNLAVHAANPVEVPAARELTNPGASPWGGAGGPQGPHAMAAIPPAAVAAGRLARDPDGPTEVRRGGSPAPRAVASAGALDDDDRDDDPTSVARRPNSPAVAAAKATMIAQQSARPPQGPTVALSASITAGGIPNPHPSPSPSPNAAFPAAPAAAAQRSQLSRSGINIPATTALAAFPDPGTLQPAPAAPAPRALSAAAAAPMYPNAPAPAPQYPTAQPGMHYPSAPQRPSFPHAPSAMNHTGYGQAPPYQPSLPPPAPAPARNNALPFIVLALAIVLGAGATTVFVMARRRARSAANTPTTVTAPAPIPVTPVLPAQPGYGTLPAIPPGMPGNLGPLPTIPPPNPAPGALPAPAGDPAAGNARGTTGADAGAARPPEPPPAQSLGGGTAGPAAASNGQGSGTADPNANSANGPNAPAARHAGGSPADTIRRQLASARGQVADCLGGTRGAQVEADVTYDGEHQAVSHVSTQITGSGLRPFASLCIKHALQNAVHAPSATGSVSVHYAYQF